MTRIAIISDHYLAGSGIAALLRQHSTYEVFGPPAAEEERRRLLVHSRPDVTILLSTARGSEVVDLIEEVKAEAPGTSIAFISLQEDEEALLAALRAGARGALGASLDGSALVNSVAELAAGEIVISRVARRLVTEELARASLGNSRQSLRVLTPRELAILRLISRGESNKKIARELSISEHTVRAHVRTIMRKLEVANRVQAAALALQNGLAVS
ncbi:MAG TPA: response regulator transcription factor [Dehalococcoidia bacterium]|nr:response regulator transcription factor [Dehalococcoidia bacterium]